MGVVTVDAAETGDMSFSLRVEVTCEGVCVKSVEGINIFRRAS